MFKPLFWVVIGSVLFLCACSTTRPYTNIQEYPSSHGDMLAVIDRPWSDVLCYVGADGQLIPIGDAPGLLGGIQNIHWSPSDDYVLIESYGEGDQNIAVFARAEFQNIIDTLTRDPTNIPTYRHLDPYLHGLDHIQWTSNTTLSFRSTGDFTRFDPSTRRAVYLDEDNEERTALQEWLWDIRADTFTCVAP